jgi:hypothetical protein
MAKLKRALTAQEYWAKIGFVLPEQKDCSDEIEAEAETETETEEVSQLLKDGSLGHNPHPDDSRGPQSTVDS